jgi:hypothetical protein
LFLESIKGQVVRVRNYEESSIIDLNSYSCSSRRRKGVEIGEKLGYVFGEVIESERTEAIQALLDFGISKGIKMLPLNRFLYILERHGQFFKLFAVKSQDGRIVSCAITQAIDLCLRVPNYFGMRETKGSTDYLVHGLLTMAKEENFEILDLGSSTDPNSRKINQGIVQYKKEWGAKHCTIPTLSWIL